LGKPLSEIGMGGQGAVYEAQAVPRRTDEGDDVYGSRANWSMQVAKFANNEKLQDVLFDEYAIAHFLETVVPSFVAAPFAYMRAPKDLRIAFVQAHLRGAPLYRQDASDLYPPETYCHMYLRTIEFVLRLGGTVSMEDVTGRNSIVVPDSALHLPELILFDFGHWTLESDPMDQTFDCMMQNFRKASSLLWTMRRFMQLPSMDRDAKPQFKYAPDADRKDAAMAYLRVFCDDLFTHVVALFTAPSNPMSARLLSQYDTVVRLCGIRYAQIYGSVPCGAITEVVPI
jgi:hypothetical protein